MVDVDTVAGVTGAVKVAEGRKGRRREDARLPLPGLNGPREDDSRTEGLSPEVTREVAERREVDANQHERSTTDVLDLATTTALFLWMVMPRPLVPYREAGDGVEAGVDVGGAGAEVARPATPTLGRPRTGQSLMIIMMVRREEVVPEVEGGGVDVASRATVVARDNLSRKRIVKLNCPKMLSDDEATLESAWNY